MADCGAKILTNNCTSDLLNPRKSGEKSFENEPDSVLGNLDSILTAMINNSKTTTDICLGLPKLWRMN